MEDNEQIEGLQLPAIQILPVSKAKGLEYAVVFLLGMDRMSRSGRSKDEQKYQKTQMFIGLTRAKKSIYIVDSGGTTPVFGSINLATRMKEIEVLDKIE